MMIVSLLLFISLLHSIEGFSIPAAHGRIRIRELDQLQQQRGIHSTYTHKCPRRHAHACSRMRNSAIWTSSSISLYATNATEGNPTRDEPKTTKRRRRRKSTKRSWTSSATTITGKWRQNYEALQVFAEQNGHTRVPYNYALDPPLGRWVMRQRALYAEMQSKSSSANKKMRPATMLTQERIEALEKIGFSFESPRKRTWNKRFDELCQYRALYGDCLVPLKYDNVPGLGVWVRNQRTQYRNLLMGKKQGSLTPEKIAALQSIGFIWYTQRDDQWKKRFDELVDFKAVYGHCSVPEKYHENPQLGAWVTNQRTSYKNFFAGNVGSIDNECEFSGNSSKGLTKNKIAALESIGFCWDQTTYNWYSMYERLKQFKQQNMQKDEVVGLGQISSGDDHDDASHYKYFHVPPEDVANRDLRLWILVQRREYSVYMQNKNSSAKAQRRTSMTPRRQRALDAINFPWSINKQKYKTDGPTVDDWTKLFEQMRERGIDKNVRPKEHWFEGQSLIGSQDDSAEKDQWTDDDLLELWNMEDDEDEW